MRILVTHSYFLRFDPKQWVQRKPYPPLATLIAASILRDLGHEVAFYDTNFASSPEEILPLLDSFQPERLVILEDGFNYLTKMCLTNMRQAALEMIGYARSRGIPTVHSGSDSTDHFELYLENGAEAIILGEPEQAVTEWIRGEELEKIQGVAFLKEGKVVRNPTRPVLKDLDSLPFPAWDLLDIQPYRESWSIHGYFSINLATTRGCPFKCNWCAKPIYGNRYNSHSAKYIVDLIEYTRKNFSFDHIWFCDDIFGLKPRWVQEFRAILQDRDIHLRYKIQSRADLLLVEDTIQALADTGCEEVWIGAESGSQRILDAMDKGTTIEQIRKSTHLMKKHGIKPCFFLQFGYLDESWEDISLTLEMIRDLRPADIGVSVSYPLPGTGFYEKVKEQLIHKANWTDSDELLLMYQGTFSPEFYKRLHRYVHRLFRSQQGWDALPIVGKGESEMRKSISWFYHYPLTWMERARLKRILKMESVA
ncbi:MAG: B12-binding domain-containing radical SAM protein [Bacteroidota bacterium]|nr:B12-binding domain-containing radical SAM protein [Bacteroidota bacterium]MDX5506357.1 B12-binding domain-containing radical SAM protein [Bacteroidota bacterium]